mgnify:CR=1 FL=1
MPVANAVLYWPDLRPLPNVQFYVCNGSNWAANGHWAAQKWPWSLIHCFCCCRKGCWLKHWVVSGERTDNDGLPHWLGLYGIKCCHHRVICSRVKAWKKNINVRLRWSLKKSKFYEFFMELSVWIICEKISSKWRGFALCSLNVNKVSRVFFRIFCMKQFHIFFDRL